MKKDENDIIEAEYIEENESLPAISNNKTQVDIEFEYAKSNIVNILETSKDVLNTTAELITDTEHPRMIEVYTNLIKNIADVNKSLFDIREKKMLFKGELVDKDEVPVGATVNNNAIFVGSTEELLQTLKDKEE